MFENAERVLKRYREIIPRFDEFMRCVRQPLPRTVRINTLKASVDEVLEMLSGRGIRFERMEWYEHGIRMHGVEKPGLLLEYFLGYIHPQEEVSMIPPVVLEPKPDELILDMCAAPGSKATQISQMMENRGHVVANDANPKRILMLRSNYERLGVLNMSVTVMDGRRFPQVEFDRVLVDAPCTCEGIVRKNPAALHGWSLGMVWRMHRLQRGLLMRAVELVKPGGLVVYSTCTFAPEENEAVVDYVLKRRDDLRLEEVRVGLEHSPGITRWGEMRFSDELSLCARFYPHQNDTGGLFVARIRKLQEGQP